MVDNLGSPRGSGKSPDRPDLEGQTRMDQPAPGAGTTQAAAARRTSQARQRIVQTAARLFYDEGIHAVGIQRIVAESAVTRVTLYRHFASKDDLIAAYLDLLAQADRDQVNAVVDAHPDDPRLALTELATALTRDDFAVVHRGCPFINASAEFTGSHPARAYAREIRRWVTDRLAELLRRVDHRDPRAAAEQLMMVRTG